MNPTTTYLLVTEDVLIQRIRPGIYKCFACELQTFNVTIDSPRKLLDHVELHRHAGHNIPASALEIIKGELA